MPRPRNEQGPTTMVRIDHTLYERIARMAAQNRRSIRAQASLLLERALEHGEDPPLFSPEALARFDARERKS